MILFRLVNENIFAALHQFIATESSIIDEILEGVRCISSVTVEFRIRDIFGRLLHPHFHSWEAVRKRVDRRTRAKHPAGTEILIFVPAARPHPGQR